MRLLLLFLGIVVLSCCNSTEQPKVPKQSGAPERSELSMDSKIFLGNRLFSEKTCIKCHSVDEKKIGPSIVDIVRVYKDNNADIVSFLKGNSKPIVDTTKSQVAIMQDNINGFLKQITDEELDAISIYMMHVDELNNK